MLLNDNTIDDDCPTANFGVTGRPPRRVSPRHVEVEELAVLVIIKCQSLRQHRARRRGAWSTIPPARLLATSTPPFRRVKL